MTTDVEREQDAALAWEERKAALIRPPTIVGPRAMLEAAEHEAPFLVPEAIPAGAITLIVGQPGAKKSWLAYALALATARGGEWLGRAVTPWGKAPGAGSVVIFNYDNPTNECGRRFKRLGMVAADPIFFHSDEQNPLRLPKAADDLIAISQALKPALIIADSFRQSHMSDENSSAEMADVMRTYKALCTGGAAVVVVHHASKSELSQGIDKVRGSGEIAASADAIIQVAKTDTDDLDSATWSKHRCWAMSDAASNFAFELRDVGIKTELRLA